MKAKWQQIIEERRGYDHPNYPVSQWKRDALSGQTRLGYADIISTKLLGSYEPIPEPLKQFKPRGNFGRSVQQAAVAEFEENSACLVVKADGHGWFVMRHAFETLTPFIVARGDKAFIIAKDTDENRGDLRELGAEMIYEWDGYSMIDYKAM